MVTQLGSSMQTPNTTGGPASRWRTAVGAVTHSRGSVEPACLSDDIVQPPPVRVADCKRISVLVHHLSGVPDAFAATGADLYVKGTLQGCSTSTDIQYADSSVEWGEWLTFSNQPQEKQRLQLVLTVMRRRPLWVDDELARCVLELGQLEQGSDLLQSPQPQQLVGPKGQPWGQAALHVQLVATSRKEAPSVLQVLAGTWNVGNALPPPAAELRGWLTDCLSCQHHLIVVGSQECNYSARMPSLRRRMNSSSSTELDASMTTSYTTTTTNSSSSRVTLGSSCCELGRGTTTSSSNLPSQQGPSCNSFQLGDLPSDEEEQEEEGAGGRGKETAAKQQQQGDVYLRDQQPRSDQPSTAQQKQQQGHACKPDQQPAPDTHSIGHQKQQVTTCELDQDPTLDQQSELEQKQQQQQLSRRRLLMQSSKWWRQTQQDLVNTLVNTVDSSLHWQNHICEVVGPGYRLVASHHMFQTRLLVLARTDILPLISNVTSSFEATGVGRVGVNKGGVAVSLEVGGTTLTFISAHLAAHQGKVTQRNADVAEITQELRLAAKGADAVTSSHHVVWLGDLNYRVDYGQQALTGEETPAAADWSAMTSSIYQGTFQQDLLPLDQLHREQAAGRVFVGFKEGPITFAPTFKVIKGTPKCVYTPKRSPAWCDRVLVRSNLPHRPASVQQYWSDPSVATSDHKPVAARLHLPTVPKPPKAVADASGPPRWPAPPAVKLRVVSIKVQDEATRQLLLSSIPVPHRKGQRRAMPPLHLKFKGRGLAGGTSVKVKLVKRALYGSTTAPRQKQAEQQSAEPERLNLLRRPVMVPLAHADISHAKEDWVTICLYVQMGVYKQAVVARGLLQVQPLLCECTRGTHSHKAAVPGSTAARVAASTAAAGAAAAPSEAAAGGVPAAAGGVPAGAGDSVVQTAAAGTSSSVTAAPQRQPSLASQLQTCVLHLEAGSASLGRLEVQVQVLTRTAALVLAGDAVSRLTRLASK